MKSNSIITQLRAIYAVMMMNGVIPLYRMPLWIGVYLSTPLSILFFLSLFAPPSAINEAYVGGLIMIVITNGLGLLGDAVFYKSETKFQDMVVASPVAPASYMFGLALSELVYSFPGVILLFILIALKGLLTIVGAIGLVVVSMLAWAFSASMGFFLSTRVTEMRHVYALSALLATILSLLPPVYYSISLIPEDLRWLVYLVPTTHVALLAKNNLGITSLSLHGIAFSWVTLIAYTALFIILAMRKARWREP